VEWQLLADVPDETLRTVLSIARRRTFAKNEIVFHRGDPADSLHLIVKGRFAVRIATPLGDTATLSVRGPGDAYGELALLGEESARSATVSALEPAETHSIYRGDFIRLRREHPRVNEVLSGILAEHLRRLSEQLIEAYYVPADRRVLRRVRDLVEIYGRGSEAVVIPLTQEDIAGLAGTSRATVNRVLREEERRGTVELRRGKTVVLDLDELARRAEQGAADASRRSPFVLVYLCSCVTQYAVSGVGGVLKRPLTA
jgi:CRP/FNR family transcriptional regulator, cyclic AMP receptor protein